MKITLKTIFYVVYFCNLIYQIGFIGYKLLAHNSITTTEWIIAVFSIAATTLIYIFVKKLNS
ncbi:hypothetical protein [Lactobacillus helveticus]|uniref:hypothetical protein n=1 Tax=Lactobacillus helveticus TaxID=1587 RepID=UPI00156246A6|nr:hypothetical protein [Lactobacillus helveticus]NRN76219.1 hypothetical protein [Lactobacillus helveticus]NRO10084.1 hypothetical protein [Lactobacillus helveticus]NRO66061.1 hypothetical protein [Lactobacillus helveticus]